jgi:hypothetical protein
MLLYLRCLVANRIALCGVLLLISSRFVHSVPQAVFVFIFGLAMAGCTRFGLDTVRTYKRIMKHYDEFGSLDPRYEDRYHLYCDTVAIKLARKDFERRQKARE